MAGCSIGNIGVAAQAGNKLGWGENEEDPNATHKNSQGCAVVKMSQERAAKMNAAKLVALKRELEQLHGTALL
jgi:hypothetical protein